MKKGTRNTNIKALVTTINANTPQWGKNCFIAENAALSGDCVLGDDCSVWYSAVLRSDVDAIRCGNRVNIQDCACVHQTGGIPCVLEDDVSVGHGAVVHGATVRKGALIGMNATVLDKAGPGRLWRGSHHCCWSCGASRHACATA